jgi:hypothetical protein
VFRSVQARIQILGNGSEQKIGSTMEKEMRAGQQR